MNKNLKRLILNLFEKVVFLDPKDCCPPLAGAKKTFSSTLNVMISQMVRNESVRFGGHIDIEVSYKILHKKNFFFNFECYDLANGKE
jgi:hypothetical protein